MDAAGLGRPGFLAGGGILPNTIVGALTPSQARFLTQGYIPDQKRPQSIQWNFGIQHVFAQDYTAEVRYLGTRGLFLPLQVQLNRQAVVNPANALPVYVSMPSQAALDGLSNTLAPLQAGFRNGGDLVPSYAAAGGGIPGATISTIPRRRFRALYLRRAGRRIRKVCGARGQVPCWTIAPAFRGPGL